MKVSTFKLYNRPKNNGIGEETIENVFYYLPSQTRSRGIYGGQRNTGINLSPVFRFSGLRGGAVG
jgi:hypothetical protein